MKFKKSEAKKIKPKKNLGIVIAATLLIILLGLGIFFGLSKLLETEDYYILNVDVPAKTQVNETMLTKVSTAKGTAPKNAITLSQVRQGTVYTKIPLKTWDILSSSNTGLNLDTSTGIPESWGVVSFNISADYAAGGNIAKGDYFDVLGIKEGVASNYLFYNVLVLDRNYNEAKNVVNKEGEVIPLGETLQYIVGMPPENIAEFESALVEYDQIVLVLSPNNARYNERNLSGLDRNFLVGANYSPVDLLNGTDPTFTPILRDKNGRPVNHANCEAGVVSPISLCDQLPPKSGSEPAQPTTQSNTIQFTTEERSVQPLTQSTTEEISETANDSQVETTLSDEERERLSNAGLLEETTKNE